MTDDLGHGSGLLVGVEGILSQPAQVDHQLEGAGAEESVASSHIELKMPTLGYISEEDFRAEPLLLLLVRNLEAKPQGPNQPVNLNLPVLGQTLCTRPLITNKDDNEQGIEQLRS